MSDKPKSVRAEPEKNASGTVVATIIVDAQSNVLQRFPTLPDAAAEAEQQRTIEHEVARLNARPSLIEESLGEQFRHAEDELEEPTNRLTGRKPGA